MMNSIVPYFSGFAKCPSGAGAGGATTDDKFFQRITDVLDEKEEAAQRLFMESVEDLDRRDEEGGDGTAITRSSRKGDTLLDIAKSGSRPATGGDVNWSRTKSVGFSSDANVAGGGGGNEGGGGGKKGALQEQRKAAPLTIYDVSESVMNLSSASTTTTANDDTSLQQDKDAGNGGSVCDPLYPACCLTSSQWAEMQTTMQRVSTSSPPTAHHHGATSVFLPSLRLSEKERRLYWLGTYPLLEPNGTIEVIPVMNRKIVKNGLLGLRSIFLELHPDIIVPQFVLAESSQLDQFVGLSLTPPSSSVSRCSPASKGLGQFSTTKSSSPSPSVPIFSSFLFCLEKQLLQGIPVKGWSTQDVSSSSGDSHGGPAAGDSPMVTSVLHTIAVGMNVVLDSRQCPLPVELLEVQVHMENPSISTTTAATSNPLSSTTRRRKSNPATMVPGVTNAIAVPGATAIAITNATHLLPPLFPVHVTSFNDFIAKRFRPEFVRDYVEPLCSTAFYASCPIGTQDVHKLNIMRAMLHLVNIVIPRCAVSLDRETEPLYGESLCKRLHMYGINLQFLGWIIPWLKNPDAVKAVYTEITARSYRHVEAEQAKKKCVKMLAGRKKTSQWPSSSNQRKKKEDSSSSGKGRRKSSFSDSYVNSRKLSIDSNDDDDATEGDETGSPFDDAPYSGYTGARRNTAEQHEEGDSSSFSDEEEEQYGEEEEDNEEDEEGVEFQAITREAMNRYFPYHLRVPLPRFHPTAMHMMSRIHPRYGLDVEMLESTAVSTTAATAEEADTEPYPGSSSDLDGVEEELQQQAAGDIYRSKEFMASFTAFKKTRRENMEMHSMMLSMRRDHSSNTSSRVPSKVGTPTVGVSVDTPSFPSGKEDGDEENEEKELKMKPEEFFPCISSCRRKQEELGVGGNNGKCYAPGHFSSKPSHDKCQEKQQQQQQSRSIRFGVDLTLKFTPDSVPPTPDFALGFEYQSLLLPELIDGEMLEERIGELCSRKKVMAVPGKYQNLMRERVLEITPANTLALYAEHVQSSLVARRSWVESCMASGSPLGPNTARLIPLLKALAQVNWSLYPYEFSIDDRSRKLGLVMSTSDSIKNKALLSERSSVRQALEILELAKSCTSTCVVDSSCTSSNYKSQLTTFPDVMKSDNVATALLYLGLVYFEAEEYDYASMACSEALQIVSHQRIKLRILMLLRDTLKNQNKGRHYLELVEQLAIVAPLALNVGHPLRSELIPRQAQRGTRSGTVVSSSSQQQVTSSSSMGTHSASLSKSGMMMGFSSITRHEKFMSHGVALPILDLVRQKQCEFLDDHYVPFYVNHRCFEVSGTGQSVSRTYALILTVVNGFLNGVGMHRRLQRQECLVYVGQNSKTTLLAEIIERILHQRPFPTSTPPTEFSPSSPTRRSTTVQGDPHSPLSDLMMAAASSVSGKRQEGARSGSMTTLMDSMIGSVASQQTTGTATVVPIYIDASKFAPLNESFLERALAPLTLPQIQLLANNPKILLLVDGVGEGPKGLGGLAGASGILRWKCKKIITVKSTLVDHMSEKQLFDALFPHDIVAAGLFPNSRHTSPMRGDNHSDDVSQSHNDSFSPSRDRLADVDEGGSIAKSPSSALKVKPLSSIPSMKAPSMHFLPLSPRDAERYTLKTVSMFRGCPLSHPEAEQLLRQYHRSFVFSEEKKRHEELADEARHRDEKVKKNASATPQFSSVLHNPDHVLHCIQYRMPKLYDELKDPLLCALVASVAEDVLKYESDSGWICCVDVLDAIVLKKFLIEEDSVEMREEAMMYASSLAVLMNLQGSNSIENPMAAQYQHCLPLTINPSTHMVSFVHPIFGSYFLALKLFAEVIDRHLTMTTTPFLRQVLTSSFIQLQKTDAKRKTEGNLKALLLSGFSASRSQGTVLRAVEKFKASSKSASLSGGEWLCTHSLAVLPDRCVLGLLCDRALTIESFKTQLWKYAENGADTVLKNFPSNAATVLASAKLSFSGRSIRNGDFTQAWLPNVTAVATDARCTTWNRATIPNGNLSFADFSGADMRGLDLGAPVKMKSKKATTSKSSSSSAATSVSCILAVAFPPNNCNIVLAGSDNGTITKWDVETGHEGKCVQHGCAVSCLCFSEDGSRLASGSLATQASIKIWSTVSLRLLAVLEGHGGRISGIGFITADILASGSFDWTVKLWNVRNVEGDTATVTKQQKLIGNLPIAGSKTPKASTPPPSFGDTGKSRHQGAAMNRSHSSIGRLSPLLDVNATSSLSHSANDIATVTEHSSNVSRSELVFSNGTVKLQNRAAQIGSFLTMTSHETPVTALAVSRASHLVASLSGDGFVHVCDSELYVEVAKFKLSDTRGANAISFDADGVKLAVPTRRGVTLVNPRTGAVIRSLGFSGDGTDVSSAITFSPDGVIVAAAQDTQLVLWNSASGARTFDTAAHTKRISALAFSPTGTVLVSGGWDGVLRVWPFATVVNGGAEKASTEFPQDYKFLRIGNKNRHVVCVTQIGQIDVRDVETGSFLGTCGDAEFDVACTAADISSDLVAVGNTDLYIASLFKRIRPKRLKSHNRVISGLGFLPRNSNASFSCEPVLLLSVSLDRSFRLWNANLGIQLMSHTSDTPTCSLAMGKDYVLSVSGFPSTRSLMMEKLHFSYYPPPLEMDAGAVSPMPSPQTDRLEHFLQDVGGGNKRLGSRNGSVTKHINSGSSTGNSSTLPQPTDGVKPAFVKQLKLNVSGTGDVSASQTPSMSATTTLNPSLRDEPIGSITTEKSQPMSLRNQRTLVLLARRKGINFDLSTSRILSFLRPAVKFETVSSAGPIKTPVKEGTIRAVLCCGDHVGALCMDKYVSIWDLEKKECIRSADMHALPITGMDAFGDQQADGMIATSSQDGSVLVSKLTGERVVVIRPAYQRQIVGVRFTPKMELVTCGNDRITRKWNLSGAKCAVGNNNPFAALSPVEVRLWLNKNGLHLLGDDLDVHCCGSDLVDVPPEEVPARFLGMSFDGNTMDHTHSSSATSTPGLIPVDKKALTSGSDMMVKSPRTVSLSSTLRVNESARMAPTPSIDTAKRAKWQSSAYRKQVSKLQTLLRDVRSLGNKVSSFVAIDDAELTSAMFGLYSPEKVVAFAEKVNAPAMAKILGLHRHNGQQLLQMSLQSMHNIGSLDWEDLAMQVCTEMASVRQKLRDSFAEKSADDVLLFARTKSPTLQIALTLLSFSGVQLLDRTNFVYKATYVCHDCKTTIRDTTTKCEETGRDHTELKPIPDRETTRHLQRLTDRMKEIHQAECTELHRRIQKFPNAELSCGIHWHAMTGDSSVIGVLVFHVPSMGQFGPQLIVNEASLTISATDRTPPKMVAVLEKSSRTLTQLAGIRQITGKYSATNEDLSLPSGWKKVPIAHNLLVEANNNNNSVAAAAAAAAVRRSSIDDGIGSPGSQMLSPHQVPGNPSFAKYSFAAGSPGGASGITSTQSHMYQHGTHTQLTHPTMPKSQNLGISGSALISNVENVVTSEPGSPGSPMSPYSRTQQGKVSDGSLDERIPPKPEHFFKHYEAHDVPAGQVPNTLVADVTEHVRHAIKRKEKYVKILVVAQSLPDVDVYFHPSMRPTLSVNFFHADKLCGCKATSPPLNIAQPLKPLRLRDHQSDASSSTANPNAAQQGASLLCDRFCNIDSACEGHSCSFTTSLCRKAPFLVWQSLECEGGNYFSAGVSKAENISHTNMQHIASHCASAFGNSLGPKPAPTHHSQSQKSPTNDSMNYNNRANAHRRSSLRGAGERSSGTLNTSVVIGDQPFSSARGGTSPLGDFSASPLSLAPFTGDTAALSVPRASISSPGIDLT